MSGYEEAKATIDKIKSQPEDNVIATMQQVQANEALRQMYADSASVGSENLGGELPLLKVHATGKSSKNILADGSKPNDGWFFYKKTAEQFKTLKCHILTISKGFKAEGLEKDETGKARMIFNQIMGGVIIDPTNPNDYKLFIMYFTGKKLNPMWEFGKEASKYTKAKPVGIPMFALTVSLETETQKNDFGESWIVNFEIEKTPDLLPVLVMDPGRFQFLKDSVGELQDIITSLIESKTKVNDEGEHVIIAEEERPF